MPSSHASAPLQRCEIIPVADQAFRFSIDGREVTCWHFGESAPRPYFFPVCGPSGVSLTRMGHPGAPNHDHHRSLWFAHNDLLGIDFWSENTTAKIRQVQWYAIDEGNEFARIGFELHWLDGHDPTPLVQQTVFATIRPTELGWSLELQSDFSSAAEGVEFRQSNFGVVGLRVAKSLSVVFGDGTITGADGKIGERALFGRPNRWVDYRGPIARTTTGEAIIEGLTLIDHSENPGHGDDGHASWHVRDDGWIGPSLSRHGPIAIPPGKGVTCRYLLHVTSGAYSADATRELANEFDARPPLTVQANSRPHFQYEITSKA